MTSHPLWLRVNCHFIATLGKWHEFRLTSAYKCTYEYSPLVSASWYGTFFGTCTRDADSRLWNFHKPCSLDTAPIERTAFQPSLRFSSVRPVQDSKAGFYGEFPALKVNLLLNTKFTKCGQEPCFDRETRKFNCRHTTSCHVCDRRWFIPVSARKSRLMHSRLRQLIEWCPREDVLLEKGFQWCAVL